MRWVTNRNTRDRADELEAAYLRSEDARGQSGFRGDANRWERLRRPILDAIDKSGTFLDVGCANGHLIACVEQWAKQSGLVLDVFGVDISPRLVALAREQHPQWQDRLWVANASEWVPPQRFDFVRTELVYVPTDDQHAFVRHLLANYLRYGGRLIVCSYGTRSQPEEYPLVELVPLLQRWGFDPAGSSAGTDCDGKRLTNVAWIDAREATPAEGPP